MAIGHEVYPVWLGRVDSDVVTDEGNEHYIMVHVQWWVMLKKGVVINVELYRNCWRGKWKCNLNDPM
jgi:hypothetical protein